MTETKLPWSDATVAVKDGVREEWAGRLGANARFLPKSVRLFADPRVPSSDLDGFVDSAGAFLLREMSIRTARVYRMGRATSLSAAELEESLTAQTHNQGWALYYSEKGGLPAAIGRDGSENGLVPCSSMRNHGVGWRLSGDSIQTWLVTARKPGREWDMDSDVGHESAHAGFAPVPLFASPGIMESVPLSLADVAGVRDIEPEHVVRLLYFYSEIAVVAVRGEARPTNTRLPISDPEELYRLFGISEELFPGFGFDVAQHVCTRAGAYFDPKESDAIFDIAAPVMRILPRVNFFVNALAPPTLEELCDVAGTRQL